MIHTAETASHDSIPLAQLHLSACKTLCMTLYYSLALGAASAKAAVPQEIAGVLKREAGRCRELLEIEPERTRCKWPLLTLAHILGLQHSAKAGNEETVAERQEICAELAQIDPLRKGFYADAAETGL